MWNRHVLVACVAFLGVAIVGSQLTKRRFAVVVDDAAVASYSDPNLINTSRQVDAAFARHWQELDLKPADKAENLLIIRRLSLGLTGTVPSLEELRAFESIDADQQIAWWLQHLLTDRRFSDYVAERLARAFVGTENGPFIVFRRRRFVSWLSDQLLDNRPYDEIVRALIGDRGVWTDSPSINYITVTNGTNEEGQPDPARLAARTTRAFLGLRLDCMQCHDDNLGGDWLQADFHQLAAFFSEARSSGLGIHDTDREYEFQYLGKDEREIVAPKVPFDEELVANADTRRQQLAHCVTHPANECFARATVNRVWALLCGRPLVDRSTIYPCGVPILRVWNCWPRILRRTASICAG